METYINRGKYPQFTKGQLNCIDIIRAIRFMPRMSANAYVLHRYLTTWFNGNSATPVVNPTESRILQSLPMGTEALRTAAAELESLGIWKAVRNDAGAVQQYKPLFLDYAMSIRPEIKAIHSSLNHAKVDIRYTPIGNLLAKALTTYATESTVGLYNDLGYVHQTSAENSQAVHTVDSGKFRTKLCHSVFFDHELLQRKDAAAVEAIVQNVILPIGWTTNPRITRLSVADISKAVVIGMGDEQKLMEAIEAINTAGFWNVAIDKGNDDETNPFSRGCMDWTLTFTPQHKMHSLVWDFDQNAGGAKASEWERRHGFNSSTSTEQELPPLGYHFIYGLQSVKSNEIFYVGSTTQALSTRLQQHQRNGTNHKIHERISEINADPEDALSIIHLYTVHHWNTSRLEMRTVRMLRRRGNQLMNLVLDELINDRTVKLDSRITSDRYTQTVLATALAQHNQRTIIHQHTHFMLPDKYLRRSR